MKKTITALMLLSSLSVHAQQAVVNAVRLTSESGKVHLVLDADSEIQYRLFTLQNSPRLVIDLKNAKLDGGLPNVGGDAEMVSNIRAGVQNGGDLRLVLDLKRPVSAKSGAGASFDRRLSVDVSASGVQVNAAAASPRTPFPSLKPRGPRALPGSGTPDISESIATTAPGTGVRSVADRKSEAPAPAALPPKVAPSTVATNRIEPRTAVAARDPAPTPAAPAPALPNRTKIQRDPPPAAISETLQVAANNLPDIEPAPKVAAVDTPIRFFSAPTPKSSQRAHAASGAHRDVVVVVDAGHGGHDVGAVGTNGTFEKDVSLAMATTLAAMINREPGMKAVLTRDQDEFVTLRRRMEIARENTADLFISIHADAFKDKTVSGASVYILSNKGASNEATRLLAMRENAAAHIGGIGLDDMEPELKEVLMDLSQTVTMEQSHEIAKKVMDHLDEVGKMRKSNVMRGGFVVLKSPDVPSILVETAYITNPTEEQKLNDPSHQRQIADSILTGMREYFENRPPAGTLFATRKTERLAAR